MQEQKKDSAAKKPRKRLSSPQKRNKQEVKRRLESRSFKSTVKTAVSSYQASVKKGEKSDAQLLLNKVYSLVDKGVKTGRFKANKAARTKSRLAASLKG